MNAAYAHVQFPQILSNASWREIATRASTLLLWNGGACSPSFQVAGIKVPCSCPHELLRSSPVGSIASSPDVFQSQVAALRVLVQDPIATPESVSLAWTFIHEHLSAFTDEDREVIGEISQWEIGAVLVR